MGLSESVSSSCDSKNLPRARATVGFELQLVDEPIDGKEGTNVSIAEGGWDVKTPYHAAISNAMWLTDHDDGIMDEDNEWGSDRRVIHMELDLGNSGIAYTPGDSIGILAPNPGHLVAIVFNSLLEVRESQQKQMEITLDSYITMPTSSSSLSSVESIREILSYQMDLTSIPKKAIVFALSAFCLDEKEKIAMQWLCSKCAVGKELWSEFVENQRLGVADLLSLFPSCVPPLHSLKALLGAVVPRYYSIASSSAYKGREGKLAVAFSVVRYSCGISKHNKASNEAPRSIRRAGICTSYLESILQSWIGGNVSHKGSKEAKGGEGSVSTLTAALIPSPKVRIFHKPTIHFKLPGSVSPPLILIGPGTGVAPFIGFLEHRHHLEEERVRPLDDATTGVWRGGFELEEEDLPNESVSNVSEFIHDISPGPIHLYFGCRNHCDYLYRDALQSFLSNNTLSNLQVAMSRTQTEKVYVTHRIRENSKDISIMLLEQGGYVFICGDGNHMAKDVHTALCSALVEHSEMEEEEVEEYLETLKTRRRYVLDIWS